MLQLVCVTFDLPTYAFNSVFVERVSLVAPTAVAADSVLAPPVGTHIRKFCTLVYVLSLREATALRAQFFASL